MFRSTPLIYLPVGIPVKKFCQEKISDLKKNWIINPVLLRFKIVGEHRHQFGFFNLEDISSVMRLMSD